MARRDMVRYGMIWNDIHFNHFTPMLNDFTNFTEFNHFTQYYARRSDDAIWRGAIWYGQSPY